MDLLIGIIAGGIISWALTHWYYRRANKEVPEWAAPLIAKLPDAPVSLDRLIELYHEAIQDGAIPTHPSGYIRCPECEATSDKFVSWQEAAPQLDSWFHGYKCGECNHELTSEEG